MEITRTAFGAWNGGRFMHYGRPLEDTHWIDVARLAHHQGIHTFVTADVYGNGEADSLLGTALQGIPRDSFCLVGAVGHDFYSAKRDGAKGYPRFTNPQIRSHSDYASYLRMATEKSLARCKMDKFDLLLLHNPDSIGYSSDHVWHGLQKLADAGLTERIGIAPGPANGFTLDLLQCFERFGPLIDSAMIILNPFEPWPGGLVLPSAVKHDIKVITRVVDYGGIFHDDVRPGHQFAQSDHRSFRPAGWVETGNTKLDQLRSIAKRHDLSALQFACAWNLGQPAVRCVIPTLIQEIGDTAKSIESKVEELASLPDVKFSQEELSLISQVGDNKGCMALKGASRAYTAAPIADQWSLSAELEAIGKRWGIDADIDLAYLHSNQP